jgi:hypothetical protein
MGRDEGETKQPTWDQRRAADWACSKQMLIAESNIHLKNSQLYSCKLSFNTIVVLRTIPVSLVTIA